jgi:hypothetical protein
MNIKFSYVYRDAVNYKQHNEIVFANPTKVPIEEIQAIITSKLIEGGWFIAKDWKLPDMHFKEYNWDDEIDHEWHEFHAIEETNQDATTKISIEEFIEGIR